jgi:(heptosyl)LPS beta-1,4-glucosyltransferase
MTDPLAISACIICKNAAAFIGVALDSLAWCDEIVVVDSGSTDATLEICRLHPSGKVRVISDAWRGYNPQRQFAAEQCRRDWVLLLDADEECSPELRREIESLGERELRDAAMFKLSRKNFLARRYVRCWSPDYQARFIHKGRTEWAPQSLPEIRRPKAGFALKKMRHALLHNRVTPARLEDFCDGARMQERAVSLADAMEKRGKRATLLQLLTRPWLAFIKYYIIKGGFLDGRLGLTVAYRAMVGVTLKYSVLYGRELAKRKK